MKQKVILAYSGGLDTSVILKWLINQGFEVVCFVADVGQDDDFEKVEAKALAIGASKVIVTDLKEVFVTEYIFKALQADALYEGRYLLGTAIARPLIAKTMVELARAENTTLLAHGATGKGNDQVRLEIVARQLLPDVTIIAPWRDAAFLNAFKGREDLMAYAQSNGIPITSTQEKPYSMDDNLMHISFEGGALEDPSESSSEVPFHKVVSPQEAPDTTTTISITFKEGIPTSVTNHSTNKTVVGALPLFLCLNELGEQNGIGRIDIVENRFIGIKSRGVYETPGATILWAAHLDMQTLILDREVFQHKESLRSKIGTLIYNGLWFSPEMASLMALVCQTQQSVEGSVTLELYKGNVTPVARSSEKALYNTTLASMNEVSSFDQSDATGFIKIQALRLI